MPCRFCMYFWQYFINWINLFDQALNVFLGGNARETISARAARARKANAKWAKWFCRFLNIFFYCATLGKVKGDHCDHALDRHAISWSREIWNWNNNTIHKIPARVLFYMEHLDEEKE